MSEQFELPGIADGTMTEEHLRKAVRRGERWLLLTDDGWSPIVGLVEPLASPNQCIDAESGGLG